MARELDLQEIRRASTASPGPPRKAATGSTAPAASAAAAAAPQQVPRAVLQACWDRGSMQRPRTAPASGGSGGGGAHYDSQGTMVTALSRAAAPAAAPAAALAAASSSVARPKTAAVVLPAPPSSHGHMPHALPPRTTPQPKYGYVPRPSSAVASHLGVDSFVPWVPPHILALQGRPGTVSAADGRNAAGAAADAGADLTVRARSVGALGGLALGGVALGGVVGGGQEASKVTHLPLDSEASELWKVSPAVRRRYLDFIEMHGQPHDSLKGLYHAVSAAVAAAYGARLHASHTVAPPWKPPDQRPGSGRLRIPLAAKEAVRWSPNGLRVGLEHSAEDDLGSWEAGSPSGALLGGKLVGSASDGKLLLLRARSYAPIDASPPHPSSSAAKL